MARESATFSASMYLYFLSQTLFRYYRLIDLNELVGKMAVLGSLVGSCCGRSTASLLDLGTATAAPATRARAARTSNLLNALVASFDDPDPCSSRCCSSWLETGIIPLATAPAHRAVRGRLELVRRELPGVVDVADMVLPDHQPRSRSRAGSPTRRSTCSTPTAPGSTARGLIGRPRPSGSTPSPTRLLLDRVRGGLSSTRTHLAHELEELAATTQHRGQAGPGARADRPGSTSSTPA